MTIEKIAEEVERLRGEVRRLRQVGLALAVVAACGVMMGNSAPEEIPDNLKARRFSLIDGSGRTAASLEFRPGARGEEATPRLQVKEFATSILTEVSTTGVAVSEFNGRTLLRASLFPESGFEVGHLKNKSSAAMTEADGVFGIRVKNSVGETVMDVPRKE